MVIMTQYEFLFIQCPEKSIPYNFWRGGVVVRESDLQPIVRVPAAQLHVQPWASCSQRVPLFTKQYKLVMVQGASYSHQIARIWILLITRFGECCRTASITPAFVMSTTWRSVSLGNGVTSTRMSSIMLLSSGEADCELCANGGHSFWAKLWLIARNGTTLSSLGHFLGKLNTFWIHPEFICFAAQELDNETGKKFNIKQKKMNKNKSSHNY